MRSTNERRLAILNLLSVRRHEKIANLSFEFKVSERTIRYDIEVLSLSHPIYTGTGPGGGVYFMDGCSAGRKYLTEEQESLLNKLLLTLNENEVHIMQAILKTFSVPKRPGEKSK